MEAIKGKRIISMFRLLSKSGQESAKRPALMTESSEKISVSADATQTKDGVLRSAAAPEIELEFTSVMGVNDPMIDDLKAAVLNGDVIEAWSINLDKKGTGENASKYKATYYRGYGTSFEVSAPADGNVEVTFGYGVEGKGAEGFATVPQDQLDEALYVFSDTTKTGTTAGV